MKWSIYIVSLIFCTAFHLQSEAQFKGLGKKLKKKVEDRLDRKVDKASDDGLDEVEQGIEESVKGEGDEDLGEDAAEDAEEAYEDLEGHGTNATAAVSNDPQSSGDFEINTKFDYVPGEKLMVFEDFSEDAIGDFPARWNTDGTGEVVTFGNSPDKWFLMKSGSHYIPDLPYELPESYTIEFDLAARGLDQKTSSSTKLEIILDDNALFDHPKDRAVITLPLCQYHPVGIRVNNRVSGKGQINNNINTDIRTQVVNQPHISIAVNKTRFRLWVNEKKQVDVPRLIPPGRTIKYLKFQPVHFKDGKEDLFIRNLKIAEGGLDLRAQLLKDGKVSTNGILFDVNSANLRPESYGVIRQIAMAMNESDMNLTVIGHTDSDGDDQSNMQLSEKRAAAVKQALVNDFGVDAARLSVKGKGESEPVEENNSPEGKAANRRVEFVSL